MEVNPNAARTYARNLHRELPIEDQDLFAIPRDIRRTDPLALLREFGHRSPVAAVDIIVGGPPCQAYARVGRAKLRKVKDHPEAFQLDERGSLYEHYLRFVATLKPVAILMENVPDILNYGGRNIAEEISENLEELGYSVAYTLLNAAAYGVPQTRERFFLMAWHSQVSILPPSFPPPTRHVKEMPVGYKGTRAVASRLSAENRAILPGFRRSNRYVDVGALPSSDLQGPVTAFEAIGDLPRIMGHLDGSIRRGPRRFDSGVPYDAEPVPHPVPWTQVCT